MKRIIATAAIIAAMLGSTAAFAGPVAIPDTAAGHVLADWIKAVNSGDAKTLQNFIDTYHRKSKPETWIDFHKITGDLSVLKLVKNEPNDIYAIIGEADTDDVLYAKYTTDPKDPKNVVFGEVGGIDRPADVAIPRVSQDEALKALTAKIDGLVAQDKWMGAVLVESHGKILLDRAWGYGDRAAKIPLKVTDKFRVGSMDKMFTAVSTLQLIAKEKLSLDGTVGQYLPDYPNKEIANKATIRMLLTHSGGTGDIFGDDFDKHRLEIKTLADYVKLYGARAPEFPPGTSNDYSNFGFILLGVIIQKVSGEDYYDYVQKRIFEPAGMIDSGFLPESVNVPGRVNGYMPKDGKWVINTDTLPWRGTSAGGGYSTLADLLKFAHATMDGKLLPNDLRDVATSSQTKGDWYGYGFEVHDSGLAHSYGHTGGAPGMSAEMRVYPGVKTVIIGLCNVDTIMTGPGYYGNRMPLVP